MISPQHSTFEAEKKNKRDYRVKPEHNPRISNLSLKAVASVDFIQGCRNTLHPLYFIPEPEKESSSEMLAQILLKIYIKCLFFLLSCILCRKIKTINRNSS